MTPRSDLDVLQRCSERFASAADLVTDDQLATPTPCSDWSVADLLDHVTGGNWFTEKILGGESAKAALEQVRAAFSDDHLSVDAAISSCHDQLTCFLTQDLRRTYNHVVGDLTGQEILRLRIHDMSIHTWDLLQAVNPKQGLDPVYVRWAVAELAEPESLTARHIATRLERPNKPYELLLAFGRRREASGSGGRGDLRTEQ